MAARSLTLLMMTGLTGLLMAGCPGLSSGNGGGNDDGDDNGSGNGNGGGGGSATGRVVSGQISAPASAKAIAQDADSDGFLIVAHAADAPQIYTALTDADGNFELTVPEDEASAVFTFTVLSPDSQALGPICFDDAGGLGFTGLTVDGPVSLGQVQTPSAPGGGIIKPGDDNDVDDSAIAAEVTVRLDPNGVPVGPGSNGKGSDDGVPQVSGVALQAFDADQDGLIDLFDADDDGDGIIDDWDVSIGALTPGAANGLTVNVFMNLKVSGIGASLYFSGAADAIEDALKSQIVITFDAQYDGADGRTLTAVRVLESPSPGYLPLATLQGGGALWSSVGFALRADGTNRFQEWVIPNDTINAGDVFFIEATFDDGSTLTEPRMLNYVFRSIPELKAVGTPTSSNTVSGAGPFLFDRSQDLFLEWTPPTDDTGAPLTGFDYFFEIFYYDVDGQQINGIDGVSSFPAAPSAFDVNRRVFEVDGAGLTTLSSAGTFNVTLASEIFPDAVAVIPSIIPVASYKVDIAAQNNGNNSALMVNFSPN